MGVIRHLSSFDVLALTHFGRPFFLTTDASNTVVGAMLCEPANDRKSTKCPPTTHTIAWLDAVNPHGERVLYPY